MSELYAAFVGGAVGCVVGLGLGRAWGAREARQLLRALTTERALFRELVEVARPDPEVRS